MLLLDFRLTGPSAGTVALWARRADGQLCLAQRSFVVRGSTPAIDPERPVMALNSMPNSRPSTHPDPVARRETAVLTFDPSQYSG